LTIQFHVPDRVCLKADTHPGGQFFDSFAIPAGRRWAPLQYFTEPERQSDLPSTTIDEYKDKAFLNCITHLPCASSRLHLRAGGG